ncbi:MAG: T9SS type A sorting domain-containing protein, partial [Chitinophagaceae bacterium]
HVYISMVDFNQTPFDIYKKAGCCEVKIAVEQCCRNGAITTISPGNFYTDAMLNVCESGKLKNSSPVFGTFPVQYICCNNPFSYSQGISNDNNSDSISFELVAPINGNNSNESYSNGFSPLKPMTVPNNIFGFRFDSETGGFIMTPINCSEVGVIVVQVSEWKRDSARVMRKIGYTRREMELIVKNCGFNNDPYFSGNGKQAICEGAKICMNLDIKDDPYLPKQTNLDTVSVRLINQLPGTTFKIQDSSSREKSVQICWQTKEGDAKESPYLMTLEARDNYCPDPRIAHKDISILVKPRPQAKRLYRRLLKGNLEMSSVPSDSSFNSYRYQFLVMDSLGGSNSSGQFFKRVDTFQFTLPGKYYIEHTIINNTLNCPRTYIDTIIITPEHITSLAEKAVLKLMVSPNPGSGIFKLEVEGMSDLMAEVYASDGKRVALVPVKQQKIDLSSLSDGIYTIDVQTLQGVYRTQVIIRH